MVTTNDKKGQNYDCRSPPPEVMTTRKSMYDTFQHQYQDAACTGHTIVVR